MLILYEIGIAKLDYSEYHKKQVLGTHQWQSALVMVRLTGSNLNS